MSVPARLGIDGNGVAESAVYSWDFKNRLPTGAVILASPAPVFSQVGPVGQPSLTIQAPAISGTQVQARVSITGGTVGSYYETCCRITTSQNDTFTCYGTFLLIGILN